MNQELMTKEKFDIKTIDNDVYSALKNSVYPGAKDSSISMVLSYCKARQLDPLQKPVHIVPMYVKESGADKGSFRDIVMPGIGLYRIQAQRSGLYAGQTEPEFGDDVKEELGGTNIIYPKWCKITVKKMMPNGQIVEFSAKELWKENYATAGKDTLSPNAMWKKRPYAQLAKCAEAQALRKAFPDILDQSPTAEEMEGKHYEQEGTVKKKVEQLNERINQEPAVIEGEVIEEEHESYSGYTVDQIKKKILSAKTIDELILSVDLVNTLTDINDKKALMAVYREKQKELKT